MLKQRIGQLVLPRLPITRWLFDAVRAEVAAQGTTLHNALSPRRRRRLAALRQKRGVFVNVACGPQVLQDFVNLDLHASAREVIAVDCRRTLPLADGSVAGMRVEHFVEHLDPREELPAFLHDCLRVLEPGGILRIIVPDAGRYLRAYCDPTMDGFRALDVPEPFPADLPTRMDVVNHVFHQWHEHRWAYDMETLQHRLRAAGFERIWQTAFGCSRLNGLGQDRDIHAAYSLYVEAAR